MSSTDVWPDFEQVKVTIEYPDGTVIKGNMKMPPSKMFKVNVSNSPYSISLVERGGTEDE